MLNGRTPIFAGHAVSKLKTEVPQANVRGIAADGSSAGGCAALVAEQPSADILVHKVGIYRLQVVFEIPDAEWTRVFDVNVMSRVPDCRALIGKA